MGGLVCKKTNKYIHEHIGWCYSPQTQLALGIVFQCAGSRLCNEAYYSVQGHSLVTKQMQSYQMVVWTESVALPVKLCC